MLASTVCFQLSCDSSWDITWRICCQFARCSMHFQPIIFEDGEEDEVEVGGLQPGDSGQLDVPKPSERLSTAGSGGSGMSGASMGRKGSGPPPGGSAARPPGASPCCAHRLIDAGDSISVMQPRRFCTVRCNS